MTKHEEIKLPEIESVAQEIEIDENAAELIAKVDDELKASEEEFKNLNEIGLEVMAGKDDLNKKEKVETIKDNAGKWDKFKIFTREVFSGKDSEKRTKTYEKVTEKIINKELESLEKDGNIFVEKNKEAKDEKIKIEKELASIKSNKDKFEKTTGLDLENVKKAMESSEKFNPEKFKEYEARYSEELASHNNLILGKEESLTEHGNKSAEELENLKTDLNLEERVNKFKEPAERKMEKLNGFEQNYSNLLNDVRTEKGNYEAKAKVLENLLRGFKGDSELSEEMEKDIQAELDIEKENLIKLKETEEKLKSRLETVKADKKETAAFISRMNSVGKTPEEVREAKKEKQEPEIVKNYDKDGMMNSGASIIEAVGGGTEKNIVGASVEGSEDLDDNSIQIDGKKIENSVAAGKDKKGGKNNKGNIKNPTSATQVSAGEKEVANNPENKKEIIKTRDDWAKELLLDHYDSVDYKEFCNAAREYSEDKKTLLDAYDDEKMYSIYVTYLKNKKINNPKKMAKDKFEKIRGKNN